MPEFALLKIQAPVVVYAEVPGDSAEERGGDVGEERVDDVDRGAVLYPSDDDVGHGGDGDGGAGEFLAAPASGKQFRLCGRCCSSHPPGGRKRSSAEIESQDDEPSEPKPKAKRRGHRQAKRQKRRDKAGGAEHDARRLGILEAAFLWDRCMMSVSSLPHASTAFSGRSGIAHNHLHGPRMQMLLGLADKGFRYFADDMSR